MASIDIHVDPVRRNAMNADMHHAVPSVIGGLRAEHQSWDALATVPTFAVPPAKPSLAYPPTPTTSPSLPLTSLRDIRGRQQTFEEP